MSNKHRGNKHIIVRADGNLHAKIGRIMAATGADKSTVIRTAVNWMSEDQIAAIVTSYQQAPVQHVG